MKKLFTHCFALFALAASASNGLGNTMNKDFFTPLDTLTLQQSHTIEEGDQQTGFYTAPEASITIQEGTLTNLPVSGAKNSKILETPETAFYVAGGAVFFIAPNAITNAAVIYKKTSKKTTSIVAVKPKSEKITSSLVETLQVSTANNPETLSEILLISVAVSSPTPLKDSKGETAIAPSPSAMAFVYKKRKSTRGGYWHRSFKGYSNPSAYGLFSRPPPFI